MGDRERTSPADVKQTIGIVILYTSCPGAVEQTIVIGSVHIMPWGGGTNYSHWWMLY